MTFGGGPRLAACLSAPMRYHRGMTEALEAPPFAAPIPADELRDIAETLAAEFEAAAPPPPPVELEAIALDPFRLRVRWTVSAERRAAAASAPGAETASAPLALRFHHGGNGVPPYDVFLDAGAGERTFAFRRGGEAYRVALGLLRPDGAIQPLADPVSVATPPAAASACDDLRILDLRPGSALAAFATAGAAAGEPARRIVEYPAPPRADEALPPSSLAFAPLAHGSGAPDRAAVPGAPVPWP